MKLDLGSSLRLWDADFLSGIERVTTTQLTPDHYRGLELSNVNEFVLMNRRMRLILELELTYGPRRTN